MRQESFGLAVVFGDRPSIADPLHVVQFGGCYAGSISRRRLIESNGASVTFYAEVRRNGKSHSTRWIIPSGLPDQYERLVVKDLIPLVPRGSVVPPGFAGETPTVSLDRPHQPVNLADWEADNAVAPFLVDEDGNMLALRFLAGWRSNWSLPNWANAAGWIRLALRDLNHFDAAQFPLRSTWSTDPRYLTNAERGVGAELDALATRRRQVEDELARLEDQADVRRIEAQNAAEGGPRMLVSAQGHELVPFVANALHELGFDVRNSDAVAKPSDKLEDLQVRLHADDADVALVEVRAYTNGAQLGDLLRISRFVMRYVERTGSGPCRQWYIANQFVGRGPSERGRPLASNPSEVAAFAESGGVVIGIPDLLELSLRVERGTTTKDDARRLVWETTGNFELPAE